MEVNIEEILNKAGLDEPLYPGKKVVKKLKQTGEFKSHCVVYDWRNPDKIVVEVKAGLSGRDLPPEELRNYPVSLQSKTGFVIEIADDNSKKKTTKTKKSTKKKAK
jgi:hypothetical protein